MAPADRVENSWSIEPVPFPILLVTAVATARALVVNMGLIGAWTAGFALCHWLHPTGPGRWVDLIVELNPPDWGIGATVPGFLVSFVAALAVRG